MAANDRRPTSQSKANEEEKQSLIVSIPLNTLPRRRHRAVDDHETTPKRLHVDLSDQLKEMEYLFEREKERVQYLEQCVADLNMQLDISKEAESTLEDKINELWDVICLLECEKTVLQSEADQMSTVKKDCEDALARCRSLQEQLDSSVSCLEYESVKSKYDDKLADYKELKKRNRKLKKEISTLIEEQRQNEELKRENLELVSERRKLQEKIIQMRYDYQTIQAVADKWTTDSEHKLEKHCDGKRSDDKPGYVLTEEDEKKLPPVSTKILTKYCLRICSRWLSLAHSLDLQHESESYLSSNHSAEDRCLLILQAWINTGQSTWKGLLNVLRSLNFGAVAKDITEEILTM